MEKLLRILVNSHIFIGLCAIGFTFYTDIYLEYQIDWVYYLFLGTSTIIIYNLHRLISSEYIQYKRNHHRISLLRDYKIYYLYSTIILSIISFYLYLQLPEMMKILVIFPIILSLLYISPILPGRKRLRDVDFVKIILIGICWTLLCKTFPSIVYADEIDYTYISMGSFENLLFVIAISFPFDYRDLFLDKDIGTKTIVSIIGNQNAKFVSISYLLIAFVFHVMSDKNFADLNHLYFDIISVGVAYFICGILIFRAFRSRADLYYSFYLDGTMILLAVCAFIGQLLYGYYY